MFNELLLQIIRENIITLTITFGGMIYGVIVITLEYRIGKSKINPIWKAVDKIKDDYGKDKLEHEHRFSLLEASGNHLEDYVRRLDTKMDNLSNKVDQRHNELNTRLDKWFSKDENK